MTVSGVTHRSYFQRDLLISTVVTFGHPETGYYRLDWKQATELASRGHVWQVVSPGTENVLQSCLSSSFTWVSRYRYTRCRYTRCRYTRCRYTRCKYTR